MTPNHQVAAVVAIHTALQSNSAHDLELRLDRLSGQTDLMILIDQLLEQIAEHAATAEAIQAQVDKLASRKDRLLKGGEFARRLIEEAFLAAALPNLERPLARLRLSGQPATLVVEAPCAIPARYWRPGDPVLDERQLTADLKARRAALEMLLAAPADAREPTFAAFHQRFLTDREARALRARLAGLDGADSPKARAVAIAALRRDFAGIPGVSLTQPAPTLTIQLRRPAEQPRRRTADPQTQESAECAKPL